MTQRAQIVSRGARVQLPGNINGYEYAYWLIRSQKKKINLKN